MSAVAVGAVLKARVRLPAELPESRSFPCGACGNDCDVTAYGMAMWMAMSELDRTQGGQGLRVRDCVRCKPCYLAHREGLYSDISDALFETQEVCQMLRRGRQPTRERMAAALAGPFSQSVQMTIDGLKSKGGSDELG